ncbi:MAG TPA: lysis system i-spanin subunit Rz [Luteimonas sp.]|nr:lysis system i-spanin subunit Rz [Luteimonas sp.]
MIGFLASHVWWVIGLLVLLAAVCAPAAAWKLRWPIAVALVAMLAGSYWLQMSDLRVQLAQRDTAQARQQKDDAEALAAAQGQARIAEQAAGVAIGRLDANYQRGKEDAKAEFDRIAAGVRGGAVVVRKRLQCPPVAAGAAGVPGPAGTAGGGDGAAQAGLTGEDAIAALGIAANGDDAIRSLTLAQETIRAYQALYGQLPTREAPR